MAYKLTIEEERILKECNQNAQKRAFIGGCLGFYLSHFGIVALKKAFPNLVKAWKEPLQSRFPALTDKLFASNYSSTPFKISGILFRILCSVFGTYSGFISSQNVCIQRILALNTVDEPNRSHLALDLQKYMWAIIFLRFPICSSCKPHNLIQISGTRKMQNSPDSCMNWMSLVYPQIRLIFSRQNPLCRD
eukprot:Sdes_comp13161_c0_seq2m3076